MGEAGPVAVTGLPVVGVAVTVKLVLPLPAVKVMLAEFEVTVLLDTEVGTAQAAGSATQIVKAPVVAVGVVLPYEYTRT